METSVPDNPTVPTPDPVPGRYKPTIAVPPRRGPGRYVLVPPSAMLFAPFIQRMGRTTPHDGDVLTGAEAATFLRLPESVVLAEAEAGRLPGANWGGQWRFSRQGLLQRLSEPCRPSLADWLRDNPPVEWTAEAEAEAEAEIAALRAGRAEG